MKWATTKQIEFAELINIHTGIPLPEVPTRLNYQIYLSKNIEKYNEIMREKRKRRFHNGHYSSTIITIHRGNRNEDGAFPLDEEQDAEWAAAMDFSWM